MQLIVAIGFFLLALGALVSFINFYLSFVRYPIHRFIGGSHENYKWVSGIPLLGSLMLWFSIPCLMAYPSLKWFAVVVSLFDTGGIHWFFASLFFHQFFRQHPD